MALGWAPAAMASAADVRRRSWIRLPYGNMESRGMVHDHLVALWFMKAQFKTLRAPPELQPGDVAPRLQLVGDSGPVVRRGPIWTG
jgi:hypothetical protein